MNQSDTQGNLSILHFHYLLGSKENGVEHFKEKHELALFTQEEMKKAFYEAKFEVTVEEQALPEEAYIMGRKKPCLSITKTSMPCSWAGVF